MPYALPAIKKANLVLKVDPVLEAWQTLQAMPNKMPNKRSYSHSRAAAEEDAGGCSDSVAAADVGADGA